MLILQFKTKYTHPLLQGISTVISTFRIQVWLTAYTDIQYNHRSSAPFYSATAPLVLVTLISKTHRVFKELRSPTFAQQTKKIKDYIDVIKIC